MLEYALAHSDAMLAFCPATLPACVSPCFVELVWGRRAAPAFDTHSFYLRSAIQTLILAATRQGRERCVLLCANQAPRPGVAYAYESLYEHGTQAAGRPHFAHPSSVEVTKSHCPWSAPAAAPKSRWYGHHSLTRTCAGAPGSMTRCSQSESVREAPVPSKNRAKTRLSKG
eukprot:scaffold10678_cov92-Isochrysis_galbana.AAC.2